MAGRAHIRQGVTLSKGALARLMVDSAIIERAKQVHGGHICPALALGLRVAEVGLRQLKSRHGVDEGQEGGLVVAVEILGCFAQGVEVYTGHTLIGRRLIFIDVGKNAATFWLRGSRRGVRVYADMELLMEKYCGEYLRRAHSEVPKKREDAAYKLLEVPEEDLVVKDVEITVDVGERRKKVEFLKCSKCGELFRGPPSAMVDGLTLCPFCRPSAKVLALVYGELVELAGPPYRVL